MSTAAKKSDIPEYDCPNCGWCEDRDMESDVRSNETTENEQASPGDAGCP